MDAVGVAYERLDAGRSCERWPQFRLPEGTLALHQADAAIVPAGRTAPRCCSERARRHGAELRDEPRSPACEDLGTAACG